MYKDKVSIVGISEQKISEITVTIRKQHS